MHYQQYFIDYTFSYWKLLEYITLILERLLKGTREHNRQRNWIVVIGTALCRGKENSSQAFSKALYAAVLHCRWSKGGKMRHILSTLPCSAHRALALWDGQCKSTAWFDSLIISRILFRYFASFHTVGMVCLWCWYIFVLSSHYIFIFLYVFFIWSYIHNLYIQAHGLTQWCGIIPISSSSWLSWRKHDPAGRKCQTSLWVAEALFPVREALLIQRVSTLPDWGWAED